MKKQNFSSHFNIGGKSRICAINALCCFEWIGIQCRYVSFAHNAGTCDYIGYYGRHDLYAWWYSTPIRLSIVIARGNDGSSGSTKKIFAYNNEVPVLSFTGQAVGTSNRGIVLDALYWHLKGLIIEKGRR